MHKITFLTKKSQYPVVVDHMRYTGLQISTSAFSTYSNGNKIDKRLVRVTEIMFRKPLSYQGIAPTIKADFEYPPQSPQDFSTQYGLSPMV